MKLEPKQKNKELNKKNKKRPAEEEPKSKTEIINNIQAPKKYILVKVGENGEKIPLSEEEYNQFIEENPEICQLLNNKENLQKIVEEINDDDLKMHDSWEKLAKKLMNTLWRHKDADLFHKPVDPEELNIPDYFSIIKHPMDFSTIKRKLNNCTYSNLKEYCNDMDLVFDNCFLYNGMNPMIVDMCTKVKKEYDKLFDELKLKKFL